MLGVDRGWLGARHMPRLCGTAMGGARVLARYRPLLAPLGPCVLDPRVVDRCDLPPPAPFVPFNAARRGRLLDEQASVDSIRTLSWQ